MDGGPSLFPPWRCGTGVARHSHLATSRSIYLRPETDSTFKLGDLAADPASIDSCRGRQGPGAARKSSAEVSATPLVPLPPMTRIPPSIRGTAIPL